MISVLLFNDNCFCFVFRQGTLHVYDIGSPPDSVKTLKNIHWGNVVGVSCLAGNEYCVVGHYTAHILLS